MFENSFFLIRHIGRRHYHPLRHILYPHNLQHMISILFQVVFQLWLRHLRNFSKFESDLEALLKHCLFVVRASVLQNITLICQLVHKGTTLIKTACLLKKKSTVFCSAKRRMHKPTIINILIQSKKAQTSLFFCTISNVCTVAELTVFSLECFVFIQTKRNDPSVLSEVLKPLK